MQNRMDLKAGLVLEHYVLDRLIGTGGMSEVWAARDEQTQRAYALKVLRGNPGRAEEARIRLRREAYATRAVIHRAVVPVLEVLEYAGGSVLVMELLEGETLRTVLRRDERLPLRRAAALLLPVAEALEAVHAAGIIHRDLKPENIFIQRSGEGDASNLGHVRLLDFGVARFHEPPDDDAAERTNLTGIGALVGTAAYMAPEQALQPSEVDHRVDIWALGVTLYEAISGCRPVEGANNKDTLRQLLVGSITPIEVLVPELLSSVAHLIGRMLARNPERRPNGCAEVSRLLRLHAGHADSLGLQSYA